MSVTLPAGRLAAEQLFSLTAKLVGSAIAYAAWSILHILRRTLHVKRKPWSSDRLAAASCHK